MIRFFSINSVKHCKVNKWARFRTCSFSVQANEQSTQLCKSSIRPLGLDFDSYAYGALLRNCVRNDDPVSAMGLHCEIVKKGNCLDLFATNILLNVYVKCKGQFLNDAINVFDEMPERNTISFVTMIQGYVQSVMFVEAIGLFTRLHREGHELNPFVFTSVLKLFVTMEMAELGEYIHACIYKLGHGSNAFVGTALIDDYSVCGRVDDCRKVFDEILCKDMVTWTGMISCFHENDCFHEALLFFTRMRMVGFKPNNFTFAAVIKACFGLGTFDVAKGIHGCALKSSYELDIYVGVTLLDLYTQFGHIGDALRVFEEMPKKEVIPWSFMIARFAQNDESIQAVELFKQMMRSLVMPNEFTFASVLQACATLGNLYFGEQIHCHAVKVGLNSDLFVSNALMDVYAKCGKLEISKKLFVESKNKTDVSWNTILVGYVQLGDGENALDFFCNMLENNVPLTEVAFSSALRACATLPALEPGVQIHSLTIKTGYDEHIVVDNSLIDMYYKCGSIIDARLVFDRMNERDVVSWNAIISGLSMHGLGFEALNCFKIMMQEKRCKPNSITFVGLLSACSNSGLLNEGRAYFKSMVNDYAIDPCIEHYTCMVGLLGRSGNLDEAMKLIEEITFMPSVTIWRALLGACVVHNNIEIGRISAERILEIKPQDEATHVLLSNIYANAKSWKNVANVRKNMKNIGVKKEPGVSWVENKGVVRCFTVGDTSHSDMKLIHGMLEWLNMKTRQEGYVPNHSAVLRDVADDEKDRTLWGHSERLALAFELTRAQFGGYIRIFKNLRICSDCHSVIKVVSKIVQRDIVIRDMNRFHHFRNGTCSCCDYW